MKILEVLYALQSGGAERFTVDLCNEFVRKGHDVTLLTIRDIEKNPEYTFYTDALDRKISLCSLKAKYPEFTAWLKIRKLLKEQDFDVVHMHLNTIPYFFPAALKRGKCKFFHTIHSIAESSIGYPGQKLLNRSYYGSGKITPVTISDFCNKSFQRVYHLPPAACVYNGREEVVPTEKLSEVRSEVEKLKLHSDDRIFVQVATICRNKNQALAIETFARLHQEGHHAILLMLGKNADKQYLQEIMSDAAPNTFFLGEKNNMGDYLNHADAFMLTSRYEGNPISILEAFACGVTPICTAVGGIVDTVIEGESGYLAKKVEPESFYNAVMRYLNAPDRISPDTLKSLYHQKYTMEICAGEYLKLFTGE